MIPGTSAAAMGLRQGDVIIAVDDSAVNAVGQVVALMRDGKNKQFRGRVVGKPRRTSERGAVIYGEVPSRTVPYAAYSNFRRGWRSRRWSSGYRADCYSQDFFADQRSPYKQWVEGLVQRGIAVYRVEKPGMGDSRTTTQCMEMG